MASRTALVIGSGPAGFTTTAFLLRNNWRVTMLDFGNLSERIAPFQLPATLTNDNREKLVSIKDFSWRNRQSSGSLNPKRLRAEYFFAATDRYQVASIINAGANASLAFGGLSNVWGGNVLPPDAGDIEDWPIGIRDIQPYYQPVTALMPVSGDPCDSLSARFNFTCDRLPGFPLGPQAGEMLAGLDEHRQTLEQQGMFFGRAKLAIDPDVRVDPDIDPYPFGPIFNSALGLGKFKDNPAFRYINGTFIERIAETELDKVVASGCNASDGSACEFSADKVFVACGVLGTSQLLTRSFGLDGVRLRVNTSQNAFFPFIRLHRTRGVTRDRSNSISQIFLDVNNEFTQNRFAHIEVHQTGDYLNAPIRAMLGRLTPLALKAGRPLLERTIVMQAFLHSDFSDALEVRFRENDGWRAEIRGVRTPTVRRSYHGLLKFLAKNYRELRGWPLKQVLMIDPPGSSNHLGGSFPMRRRPGPGPSSDMLGRPFDCRNIHVTDSSVLPSLPATTLTFTVMVNAARIADQATRAQAS